MACNHKPPPGYRELIGEEREDHIKKLERERCLEVWKARPKDKRRLAGTCMHFYAKREK